MSDKEHELFECLISRPRHSELPRWHHAVFRDRCEVARRRLARVPTPKELERLLPILVLVYRREAGRENMMISVGMTVAFIRRATGLKVSFRAVHACWMKETTKYTAEERSALYDLWQGIFKQPLPKKPISPEEVERRAEEHFRVYAPAQETRELPVAPTPVRADNLLDLLDGLAERGLFTGNGEDLGTLRDAAERCKVKCGFPDGYLTNRIREAVARAGKAAPAR